MAGLEKMEQIKVGDFHVEVIKKDIKNLRLSIHKPSGRIRISAPFALDDETIRRFVETKLNWIGKHLSQFQPREESARLQYASGETHYLAGIPYLLNVISHASLNQIKLRDNRIIDLYEKPCTPLSHRKTMLQEWYRSRLKARIAPLMLKWQGILGVQSTAWQIKQMSTRWGTCNIRAKRIWLNLELAKHSDKCLEYIVVHELMHLLERNHNARFYALMDRFLPDWKERKAELQQTRMGDS